MTRPPSLAARFHRLLLRLLPGDFRGDFGESMAADFDERRQAEGTVSALRRETGPILAAGVREHADILRRDIVDAIRSMRRAPGLTALAVLMLALGTGANVAMFSVIDAVMLRSPFSDRERMAYVKVLTSSATPMPADAAARDEVRTTTPEWTTIVPIDRFTAIEQSPGAFAAVGALAFGDHLMTHPGDPQRPDFGCVTAGMFGVFGTSPQFGRVFGHDEDRPGAAPTVVLSDEFARSLGEPAQLVGTTLTLNRTVVRVVGVMPRGFNGIYSREGTSGWLPARVQIKGAGLEGCDLGDDVAMFVRVRKDLTLAEAAARTPGVQLTRVDELTYGNRRLSLFVLSAAVGCVLLIACINVGGLQVERSVARRRDLAIRVALGASRARLMRQALTENIVLAMGAALGAVGANALLHRALVSLLPWSLPYLGDATANVRAITAAVAVASTAALIAGIGPAVRSRRANPATDLSTSGPTSTRRHDWARRTLVVAEIAVSIVVLIAAGLMIQTFATLRPTQPGFDPRGKISTLLQQPETSEEPHAQFFGRAIDRLRVLPGVDAAEATSYLPMSGSFTPLRMEIGGERVVAYGSSVSAGYFGMVKIPVLRGRTFNARDGRASARVAIVNDCLARRLRPDGAVLGLRLRSRPPSSPVGPGYQRREDAADWQIVGVVGDTRTVGRDTDSRPEIYMPFDQAPLHAMHLVVQTHRWRDPALIQDVRLAIRSLHQEAVLDSIVPLQDRLARNVATQRFGAWLLGVFASLAVLLAATGLMATMGWWVTLRTREIGVRVALGASPARVTRLVAGQGMSIALAGIFLGCVAAAWLMRYLESWIYGVTPLDTATFVGAAVALTVTAAVAISIPMRRATRVDPLVALRTE